MAAEPPAPRRRLRRNAVTSAMIQNDIVNVRRAGFRLSWPAPGFMLTLLLCMFIIIMFDLIMLCTSVLSFVAGFYYGTRTIRTAPSPPRSPHSHDSSIRCPLCRSIVERGRCVRGVKGGRSASACCVCLDDGQESKDGEGSARVCLPCGHICLCETCFDRLPSVDTASSQRQHDSDVRQFMINLSNSNVRLRNETDTDSESEGEDGADGLQQRGESSSGDDTAANLGSRFASI
jgi:hypothetical protein